MRRFSDPRSLERRTFSLIRSGTQSIPYSPPDESEIHIHLQGAKVLVVSDIGEDQRIIERRGGVGAKNLRVLILKMKRSATKFIKGENQIEEQRFFISSSFFRGREMK